MKKLFFISDAHLGAHDEKTEKIKLSRLLSFFDYVGRHDSELIICGDLFDFWFEYRYAIPRLHFKVLSHLARLCDLGVTVHYVAGNHDFWLGSFMEKEIGLVVHHDEYLFTAQSKKFYIRHGDGILKNDYMYRFLKRVLRNPMNIFMYRLLHPDLGVPLALFFSNLSRNAGKDDHKYNDLEYREFAFTKIESGFDVVVLGHTHIPAHFVYKTGVYLNPGQWTYDFIFCHFENGIPGIFRWDGRKKQEYIP
ncbi:UDP-2,3-diacylglucosamine diphosphatase [candidate division KSB1 bacterium]|nr:UDP-2,3-diacylglucosamine diphosphatase [candidate division KSB1 bacterium]